MIQLSPPLQAMTDALARLPGVGPKTAQRLAFFLLRQPEERIHQFTEAILEAYHTVKPCETCFYLSAQNPCELCASPKRHTSQLCVVADTRDVLALERTQQYQGLYHVLGGVLSPIDGVGPEQLRIHELLHRLPRTEAEAAEEATLEVIIALPPSTEGDTTSLYLKKLLAPYAVSVSRIAFGLPVGGDLDYADQLTITRALQGRSPV